VVRRSSCAKLHCRAIDQRHGFGVKTRRIEKRAATPATHDIVLIHQTSESRLSRETGKRMRQKSLSMGTIIFGRFATSAIPSAQPAAKIRIPGLTPVSGAFRF
jgi:hypothetical protein